MRSEAEAEVTCTQGDTHTQRTSIASPGSLYAMWGRSYTHVHSIIFHAPPPPPLFLGVKTEDTRTLELRLPKKTLQSGRRLLRSVLQTAVG